MEQISRLGHTTPIYMQPRLQEYVKKLVAKMPEELSVVYLVNSGSEATELAFLMARLYTGAHEIISIRNGYHGGSQAAAASTAMSTWRYPVHTPSGHIHVGTIFQFGYSLTFRYYKLSRIIAFPCCLSKYCDR